jgi:organic hydroperoxide reductase OsmC/OhrA
MIRKARAIWHGTGRAGTGNLSSESGRGKVRNLDDPAFARFAGDAEKCCPVSRVLNAAITLDEKLVQ